MWTICDVCAVSASALSKAGVPTIRCARLSWKHRAGVRFNSTGRCSIWTRSSTAYPSISAIPTAIAALAINTPTKHIAPYLFSLDAADALRRVFSLLFLLLEFDFIFVQKKAKDRPLCYISVIYISPHVDFFFFWFSLFSTFCFWLIIKWWKIINIIIIIITNIY